MKISKLAIAALLGLGLTTGLASTSMARLSDYTGLMSQGELARAIKSTEGRTGIKLTEVKVWSRKNAAKYDRFWQAFAYNYDECVTDGGCAQTWDYFGRGDSGDGSGDAGDAGDGGGDGGGSGAAGGPR